MRRFTRGGVRALVVVIGWSLLAFGAGSPAVAAGAGVASFTAGDYHTCAARTDGTVWCWGYAAYGNLGDGTTGDTNQLRTSPVQVLRGSTTLKGVTRVAGGAGFTCAVRGNGTAWCWGDASQGQLGNGQSGPGAQRTKAVQVRRGSGFLTEVKHIATSGNHVCALRTNGSVYCWGYAEQGQVGDGTTGEAPGFVRTTAVRVRQGGGYLGNVVALAAGYDHTCAVKGGGSVWCWGGGSLGQLGDGASGAGHHRTKAVRVKRGSGYLANANGIAAGGYHTCVRRTDRTAWCWGYGSSGQLGDGGSGPTHIRTKATRVLRGSGHLTNVTGIGSGSYHTCARRSDGSAWCWGNADHGQLGDGTTGDPTNHRRVKPVRVRRSASSFTSVRALEGGVDHTCALRTDRSLWCWGSNGNAEHGRGSFDDDPHPYPRRVPLP